VTVTTGPDGPPHRRVQPRQPGTLVAAVGAACYLAVVPTRICKVLLIDDSEVSLMVAETLLMTDGYDVRSAMNVTEFYQAVSDFVPDIILSDVEMPDMTGPELCKRVKTTPRTAQVPVILYSTKPAEELAALAAECGADGYVCKADRHEGLPAKLAEVWAGLNAS